MSGAIDEERVSRGVIDETLFATFAAVAITA